MIRNSRTILLSLIFVALGGYVASKYVPLPFLNLGEQKTKKKSPAADPKNDVAPPVNSTDQGKSNTAKPEKSPDPAKAPLVELKSLGMPGQLFYRLDKDRDQLLAEADIPPKYKSLMALGDENKDGKLDFREFSASLDLLAAQKSAGDSETSTPLPTTTIGRRPPIYVPAGIRKNEKDVFRKLDRDGDGQIGLYEWPASKIVDFQKIDANKDGFLSYEEFTGKDSSAKKQSVEEVKESSSLTNPAPAGTAKVEAKGVSPAPKTSKIETSEQTPVSPEKADVSAPKKGKSAGRRRSSRKSGS